MGATVELKPIVVPRVTESYLFVFVPPGRYDQYGRGESKIYGSFYPLFGLLGSPCGHSPWCVLAC